MSDIFIEDNERFQAPAVQRMDNSLFTNRFWLKLIQRIERFSNDSRKNQNQRNYSDQSQQEPGSAMSQSQFLAISCNSLEAREKSRVHGAISFGFDSHRLKNWRESFKPIIKRSNRNHVITFDSHLKTALMI